MKYIFTSLIISIFFISAIQPVQAVVDPPLFSCTHPIGQVTVNQSEGQHGIAGDTGTYTGSDTVYRIDEDHILQCFCSTNRNQGIASNWVKATNFTEEDVAFFQRRGWVLIPNGFLWGLSADPFLVKNSSFSCQNGGGDLGGGGSSGGSSTSSSGDSGSVLGISDPGEPARTGQVLGVSSLADTGEQKIIWQYFALAIIFGGIAYRLSRA